MTDNQKKGGDESEIPFGLPAWSLNALLDRNFKEHSDEAFIGFPSYTTEQLTSTAKKDLDTKQVTCFFTTLTHGQIGHLVAHTCCILAETFPPRQVNEKQKAVCILGYTRLEYVILLFALIRLGHAAVTVSPNNSAAAQSYLLDKTGASAILYSSDRKEAASEAIKQLKQDTGSELRSMPWPTLAQMLSGQVDNKGSRVSRDDLSTLPSSWPLPAHPRSSLPMQQEQEDPSYIAHSSGSTGFPKPLPVHPQEVLPLIASVQVPLSCVINSPFSHATGIVNLWRLTGIVKKAYVVTSPDTPFTPQHLKAAFKECVDAGIETVIGIPEALKLLALDDEGCSTLSKFNMVFAAGSPLPVEVGDKLVEAGTNLGMGYGSTETGVTHFTHFRDFATDKNWQAYQASPPFIPYQSYERRDSKTPEVVYRAEDADPNGMYELVVLPGWPALLYGNRDDGSYTTKDMFKLHPGTTDRWHYLGRADDTIVHANGEKTTPVPMESVIRSSALVKEVLIVGANRTHTGCLIVPRKLNLTVEELWPVIKQANTVGHSHSRIMPEMIRILPQDTQLATTDKGSIMRYKITQAYKSEIDEIYERFEQGGAIDENDNSKVLHVQGAAQQDILEVVRQCVERACKSGSRSPLTTPSDNEDFFEAGLDSIMINYCASLLRRRFKLPGSIQELDPITIFNHPTISRLAFYIFSLGSNDGIGFDRMNMVDSEPDTMPSMAKSLATQLTSRPKSKSNDKAEEPNRAVILTGATGALGAHILAQLCATEGVTQIFCLLRAVDKGHAAERLDASLATRHLPPLTTLSKKVKIVLLPSDLTQINLGLTTATMNHLLADVTTIIHAAWPVNFNISLSSFASSLEGVKNLLDICARSKRDATPHFIFASSVAAVAMYDGPHVPEELSSNPRHALPQGYGRSKWVAEQLCKEATEKVPGLQTTILRIGQLAGDSRHGIWNTTEAWPLMIHSGKTTGMLPDLPGVQVSWLPIDLAAVACVEAAVPPKKQEAGLEVINVINDVDTPWASILDSLQQSEKGVKVVTTKEWLHALRTGSDQDPKSNPAIKLIPFYEMAYDSQPSATAAVSSSSTSNASAQQQIRMDTARFHKLLNRHKPTEYGPLASSLTLKSTGKEDVARMVAAWKEAKFLS